MTVSGAYGRDYKSLAKAKADWAEGKDFIIRDYGPDDGRYINKEDADKVSLSIMVRYSRDRKIGRLT